MIEQFRELIFPSNTTCQVNVVKIVIVAVRMQISRQLSNAVEESSLSQSIVQVWAPKRQASGFAVW